MSDNRNLCGQTAPNVTRNETICIDTYRVLDSCRDRDCYEDVRIYLDTNGQGIIDATCTIRAVGSTIVSVGIGINEVPFNEGFFQIDIRYYILINFEGCTNTIPRTQAFRGIAVLDKKVVLWGGDERVSIFRSTEDRTFCNNNADILTNFPVGVVEAVPPIVLGAKVVDCARHCGCCHVGCESIPDDVANLLEGPLVDPEDGNQLFISLGIFSVIRLERPGQFLINATPYSVPEKECIPTNESDPCSLFRTMAFPVDEFTPNGKQTHLDSRGCGRCTKEK